MYPIITNIQLWFSVRLPITFIFPRTKLSLFHWFDCATWLPSKSLCTAGKFLCMAIWRNHNLVFKKQICVSVIIYIYGPRENKSFIRFVTDCPRLCVGLLNLVGGSASMRLFNPTYSRIQSATNLISNNVWHWHSLYTALSSNVRAWGMWVAHSLFIVNTNTKGWKLAKALRVTKTLFRIFFFSWGLHFSLALFLRLIRTKLWFSF